jgi:hypothetical protein
LQNPQGPGTLIIGGVASAAGMAVMVAGVIAFRNRKNKLLREASKLSSAYALALRCLFQDALYGKFGAWIAIKRQYCASSECAPS